MAGKGGFSAICEPLLDALSDLLVLDIVPAARCGASVTVFFSSDTGKSTIAMLGLGYECIVVVNHTHSQVQANAL